MTHIQEIDSWVKKDSESLSSNSPLLVSGATCCGKSSVLSKWIEYYSQSSSNINTAILIYFVGLSAINSEYHITLSQICNTIKVTIT